MREILHIILHALGDSAAILPFLFLTYLAMELLEHKAGERVERAIARTGKAGPAIGGALGLIPQCGFSAMASGLFAGHLITPGTLLAVFLATSDEMLPIFLGAGVAPLRILAVLGIKLCVALPTGFLVDFLLRKRVRRLKLVELCEEERCHCEHGLLRSALYHTAKVFLFVLAVNLLIGAAFELLGEERIGEVLVGLPWLSTLLSALVGLIPNCAASVLIATLWTKGVISGGAMLAGLLTGAGAGLLVLFRTNRHLRENLQLLAVLLGTGLLVGFLFDLTGLSLLLGL